MMAVETDGFFRVFERSGEYDPPSEFGELLYSYSLPQTLTFRRFADCEGFQEAGYYSLKDDDYIWEVLSECRDAAFVEDGDWSLAEKRYLSFTATSEALGVYKRVFYVTDDGYIKTNIFGWGYTFDIGEAAAGEIISYAIEHAAEAEFEPYIPSLAGTITEVGNGYILVDDSVLCPDQDGGMVFKVLTDDLRISRCIDFGGMKEGNLVVIYFTGDIDAAAGNLITGAFSMERAYLEEGAAVVKE